MVKRDVLEKIRASAVDRAKSAREMVEWLSEPDLVMTRTEAGSPPEDLKAILLADHKVIAANADATVKMVDGLLSERP